MAEASNKDNPSFIQGAAPRTVLFANSSISGKLSYNLPVKIDGHFTGEIKSTELLVIGSNAQVDAHMSARQVHWRASWSARCRRWAVSKSSGRLFQG